MLWDAYQAYGTGSGCVTSQHVERKHIPGMASLASGSPAAAGVPEFLPSAAWGSLAPCNSGGAAAAGWCCWSRAGAASAPHAAGMAVVLIQSCCPCPGLAVPGSATQRGQGGGQLPGPAASCALPRHSHPRHGQRVPRAGQSSLIPTSPSLQDVLSSKNATIQDLQIQLARVCKVRAGRSPGEV